MQPESSISRFGASFNSSVDQWPQTIVVPADARWSCSNHGRKPAGAISGPRFSLNSIVPSAVQKRIRVQALTMTRSRSKPCEPVAPGARFVAVELAQEVVGLARSRALRRPRPTAPGPLPASRPASGPRGRAETRLRPPPAAGAAASQEHIAIGRLQDRGDRVLPMRPRVPGRDRQQMKVVVAENGDRGVAERHHLAQHRE